MNDMNDESRQPLERTLQVLKDLKDEGALGQFAIGGAMAAMFYAEPTLTYDLDVFVALPRQGALVTLTPLYEILRNKGYQPEGECIEIEGVPVQFLPKAGPLIEEAVEEAVERPYGHTSTRVMRPEHLIAICVQTGRAKDRDRTRLLLDEADVDTELLLDILERHNLTGTYKQWIT